LKVLIKSSGFTLIEVLITMIILSFSLLALAGLMATTTKNNANGSHITEAATFGQDKLEEIRATQWGNIPVGTRSDQKSGSTGLIYTRNWNVSESGKIKTITITIDWNDKTNHSVRLLSAITQ
jgi:prepilin-type N-terminal cleavage/methylation domain-containing protein